MRGIETPITKIRRQVFTEVAKVAFELDNINDDIGKKTNWMYS